MVTQPALIQQEHKITKTDYTSGVNWIVFLFVYNVKLPRSNRTVQAVRPQTTSARASAVRYKKALNTHSRHIVDVPEIKLIRTDTTLDLSQKAEKV